MTRRIVLSLFLAVFLLIPIAVGVGYARGDGTGPPPTGNGIGTSPSADDEPSAVQSYPEPLLACGIWIRATPDLADQASLAGEPPDIVVSPTLHASCWDAVMIGANLYPARSFVRGLVYQGWRAREAPTPHASLHLAAPAWRHATLHRALPTPTRAGLDWFSLVVLLAPIIQTVIGKIFASQVKDSNRRTEILGYADTAFQVVEAVGPQLGLSGKDKYLRFVEQVINSLKAAGKPEPTAQEMQLLKQLATDKAYLAKALPLPRAIALPLPPPPRAG